MGTDEAFEDKGYFGLDAAEIGRPAEERDVQRSPVADPVAANIGTQFESETKESEPQESPVEAVDSEPVVKTPYEGVTK